MTSTSPHLEMVNLTVDDLERNAQGLLSLRQRRLLSQQRFVWIAESVGLILILASLFVLALFKLRFPSFASRGELLLWFPVGLLWLWLLRSAPVRWLHTVRELREGNIAMLEGPVQCEFGPSIGLVQLPHYHIRAGGYRFGVSQQTFFQFRNREHYRVFHTPYSKILLGALRLDPWPSSAHPPGAFALESTASALAEGPSPHPLRPARSQGSLAQSEEAPVEPLTTQEREILRRIALGQSNKEIATALALSVNTIKMYASQIYRKLGVRRRTEAVARARRLRIL